VQEYAAEQLRGQGGFPGSGARARERAEHAHCAHFAGLDAAAAMAQGGVEIDNLVAACRRALRLGDAALGTACLHNAWAVLDLRGPFRLGLELAEALLPLTSTPGQQASVHVVAMRASRACGLRELEEQHAEAALRAAREAGDRSAEARALGFRVSLLAHAGRTEEARSVAVQAVQTAATVGDAALNCDALNGLGSFLIDHGDFDGAHERYQDALRIARAAGLAHWEGGILGNLGNLDLDMGRPADARANLSAAIDVARCAGDLKFVGNNLSNLGWLEHLAGNTAAAGAHYAEALRIAREIGHRQLECIVLCNLGLHLDALGQGANALTTLEQAVTVARELRDRRSEGQFLGYFGLALARQGRFAQARSAMDAGEALLEELTDPFNLALLLCARAELEQLADQADAARRYLERAQRLAQGLAAGASSELGLALARAQGVLGQAAKVVVD